MESVILLVEDDSGLSDIIEPVLGELSAQSRLVRAGSLHEAHRLAAESPPELCIVARRTDGAVLDFLYDLKTRHPLVRAVIIPSLPLAESLEKAARLNGIHFLNRPITRQRAMNMLGWLLNPAAAITNDKANFTGTLKNLNLIDVIQMKSMAGATTALKISGEAGEGIIYLEHGQVMHCVAGDKTGLEGFQEIVGWQGGSIEEEDSPVVVPCTIEKSGHDLLLDAARGMDERILVQDVAVAEPSTSALTVVREEVGEDGDGNLDTFPKILVVDDSPIILKFVETVITHSFPDYALLTVENGYEGIQAAKAYRPSVILLDYILPDFNGGAFCDNLRKDEGWESMPVILMSGQLDDIEDIRDSHPNIVRTLAKPFTPDTLVEMMRQVLQGEIAKAKTAAA